MRWACRRSYQSPVYGCRPEPEATASYTRLLPGNATHACRIGNATAAANSYGVLGEGAQVRSVHGR